jgi:hypothetical protein
MYHNYKTSFVAFRATNAVSKDLINDVRILSDKSGTSVTKLRRQEPDLSIHTQVFVRPHCHMNILLCNVNFS